MITRDIRCQQNHASRVLLVWTTGSTHATELLVYALFYWNCRKSHRVFECVPVARFIQVRFQCRPLPSQERTLRNRRFKRNHKTYMYVYTSTSTLYKLALRPDARQKCTLLVNFPLEKRTRIKSWQTLFRILLKSSFQGNLNERIKCIELYIGTCISVSRIIPRSFRSI